MEILSAVIILASVFFLGYLVGKSQGYNEGYRFGYEVGHSGLERWIK